MTKVKRLIVLPVAVALTAGMGMAVNATGCGSSGESNASFENDGGVDSSVAGGGGHHPGLGGSSGTGGDGQPAGAAGVAGVAGNGNIDNDAQAPTDASQLPDSAEQIVDGSAPDVIWSDGDPPPDGGPTYTMTCEVLVVGGGLGAVAAAHEAASWGRHTCLVSPDLWIGGQLTSQGTPPDEMYYTFSKTYASLRDRIRQHYLTNYNVDNLAKTATDEDGQKVFNPGGCWVSKLCHEPKVAHKVIKDMLAPLEASGKLEIVRFQRPVGVVKSGNVIKGIAFAPTTSSGNKLIINAKQTIDATELGDVLPLAGAAFRVGAESKAETGEPDAPSVANPNCVQPISYVFVFERRPEGEKHTIAKPANYNAANYAIGGGYKFYEPEEGASFWRYRRLLRKKNFTSGVPYDLAVINWGGSGAMGGNDFDKNCGSATGCNLLDKTYEAQQTVHQRAKDHALGFAYWIQTEVPRDDGGKGYPNLKLRPDVFDTADGLSREPYIREARRLKAVTTILEQDARASGTPPSGKQHRSVRHYKDTVGITRYFSFDLHQCAGGPAYSFENNPSGNAEIPLGALIPETIDGLLAGAKNIGVTKITNGIYRLHPGEWHIGQAAGATAAMAIETGKTVRALRSDERLLRRLQYKLITQRGAPIFWWSDLKRDDYRWIAAQMMGAASVMLGWDHLEFYPDQVVTREQGAALIQREFDIPLESCTTPTFSDVPCSSPYAGAVEALAKRGVTSGVGGGRFDPKSPLIRAQLATFMVRAACEPKWDEAKCPLNRPAVASFSDVPPSDPYFPYVETVKAKGWMQGDGSGRFNPNASVPRGHAAIALFNHMKSKFGF